MTRTKTSFSLLFIALLLCQVVVGVSQLSGDASGEKCLESSVESIESTNAGPCTNNGCSGTCAMPLLALDGGDTIADA